jgi:hypothetical protein
MKIMTSNWPAPNQWTAVLDNYNLGHPVGIGETREAAIQDLLDQLDYDDSDRVAHELNGRGQRNDNRRLA